MNNEITYHEQIRGKHPVFAWINTIILSFLLALLITVMADFGLSGFQIKLTEDIFILLLIILTTVIFAISVLVLPILEIPIGYRGFMIFFGYPFYKFVLNHNQYPGFLGVINVGSIGIGAKEKHITPISGISTDGDGTLDDIKPFVRGIVVDFKNYMTYLGTNADITTRSLLNGLRENPEETEKPIWDLIYAELKNAIDATVSRRPYNTIFEPDGVTIKTKGIRDDNEIEEQMLRILGLRNIVGRVKKINGKKVLEIVEKTEIEALDAQNNFIFKFKQDPDLFIIFKEAGFAISADVQIGTLIMQSVEDANRALKAARTNALTTVTADVVRKEAFNLAKEEGFFAEIFGRSPQLTTDGKIDWTAEGGPVTKQAFTDGMRNIPETRKSEIELAAASATGVKLEGRTIVRGLEDSSAVFAPGNNIGILGGGGNRGGGGR